MYFQAKNTAFSLCNTPSEFPRISAVLSRPIDQGRAVVSVYAVNTIFTRGLKERVFALRTLSPPSYSVIFPSPLSIARSRRRTRLLGAVAPCPLKAA